MTVGTTVPTEVAAPPERRSSGPLVPDRLAGLARAIDHARHGPRIDIRKGLLLAGSVAVGLGLVAIVLGWYGAAHSPYLFQEVPYVISGGLLGVALVAGGALFVLASWVIRLLEEQRHFARRVARTLDGVDRTLNAIASEAAAAAADAIAARPSRPTNGHAGDTVVREPPESWSGGSNRPPQLGGDGGSR